MLKSFKQLDSILRGDATRLSSLHQGQIGIPIGGLTSVLIILGIVYGICMGAFAVINGYTNEEVVAGAWMQMFASAVKLPLLFLLTLFITFPSLYVFNALVGSRLSIASALRLLIAAMGVMLAVMASLGPIVVFFSISTTSYSFMILLNVAACSVAGILGLAFLLRTLHRLVLIIDDQVKLVRRPESYQPGKETRDLSRPDADENRNHSVEPDAPVKEDPSGALDQIGEYTNRKAKSVFRIWILVYALVGAQMSWVLRPFIGNPNIPFEWFRERQSNFFEAILRTIGSFFS
jgi:hypothetical protein